VLISEPMPCIDFLRPANHHEEKHTKQLHYSIGRNSWPSGFLVTVESLSFTNASDVRSRSKHQHVALAS
jgi:hypothetical protein